MPATTTVRHPRKSTTITFTEEDHSYIDSEGMHYKSVTTFIHDLFPVFDSAKVAERIAKRDGVSADDLIQKWNLNRDTACRFGTRCHETAEAVFNSQPPPHQPESDKERKAFRAFWDRATKINRALHVCGCEILVFDPDLRIAGTVDLLCYDRNQKLYMLLDWKTNKEIATQNNYGETALPPMEYIQHCNMEHYSLQLAIYELLLRRNGYIPADCKVTRSLLWMDFAKDSVELLPCRDRLREAYNIVINDLIPPF